MTPEERKESARLACKRYREKHRDEVNRRLRERRAEDPEKTKAAYSKYYHSHALMIQTRAKKRREAKAAKAEPGAS